MGLFFAMETQWRRHAMTGSLIGLDYSVVRPTAEMIGVTVTPGVFSDLRTLESGALAAIAAKL